MNPNELFSCVLYIGFLLYFILGKRDRERMSTGAVYDWPWFFHALFLFSPPGLGGIMGGENHMGRSNKNARSRPQGRRIHVNKYINKIGRTKDKRATCMKNAACMKNASHFKSSAANLPGQVSPENPRPWVTGPLPRRYEIWFADLGDHYGTSVQSGNRPVLVISNDVGNQYSRTVTVIPLTTKLKRMDMPTHIILTEEDCCMFRPQTLQDSVLLAEQITTIAKSALCGRLCRVTSRERKQEIEQAVAAQLDMQRTSVISDSINGEDTQPDADAQSGTDTKEEPAW